MKSDHVDGMNIIEVRDTAGRMLAEVRAGGGPQLLEVETYRYVGHSMGDPERYRSQAEVTKWREDDPIGIYRKYLLKEKAATELELDEIDRNAEQEITKAVKFAESSPEPEPEDLFAHIYNEKEGEVI